MTEPPHHSTPRHADGRLTLAIEDDGIGIGADAPGTGRGLHYMRTRAGQLGGTLELVPPAGHGTRVLPSVPVQALPGAAGAPGEQRPEGASTTLRHPAKT